MANYNPLHGYHGYFLGKGNAQSNKAASGAKLHTKPPMSATPIVKQVTIKAAPTPKAPKTPKSATKVKGRKNVVHISFV